MVDIVVGRDVDDLEKFGLFGTVFVGKEYIKMENILSLANSVHLDVNKPHLILICGKRGQGKCVLPGTNILTPYGNVAIEDLFNNVGKLLIQEGDKEELYKIKDTVYLYGINEKGKLTIIKPIYFYRKYVKEKVLRIKTQLGYEIVVTKEHPLLTISESGKFIWKRADELKVGNFIGVCNKSLIRNPELNYYIIPLDSYEEKIEYSSGREKLIWLIKNYKIEEETVNNLANNDIYWDKIVEIEEINYEGWVYDLTIEKYHNFIANYIISHNSYTLASVAESIAMLPEDLANNVSIVIFDTMGIFWTMKFPNYRDAELLERWGLKPQGLKNVRILVPEGISKLYRNIDIPMDDVFTLNPSDLSGFEWSLVFNLDPTSINAIYIQKLIRSFKQREETFAIEDFIKYVESKNVDPKIKDAIINYFESTLDWGLFSEKAPSIRNLAKPGYVNILDVSMYTALTGGWSIKNLVIGLVSKKLFYERMLFRKKEELEEAHLGYDFKEREFPLVWIMIDEAHECLPLKEVTPATEPLVQIIREGRQPGITLVLATQQPGKIHTDVITQSDIVISHRVTAQRDLKALNEIMKNFSAQDIEIFMNENLPKRKGSALILDDKSERIYPVQMKPRVSWHGGQDPTLIRKRIWLEELRSK